MIALADLGTLIDTVAIYLDFIKPQIDETIKNKNLNSRNRKMNKFIKDINTKINLEYGFDKDTVVVEEGVLFDGELYLFISKAHFIKSMDLKE